MKNKFLEVTAVNYSTTGTKVLQFNILPHNKCFRPHWHDRMELIRIISGKLCVEYDTSYVTLSEGQLMIIPPKMLHKGYTLDESVEYTVIMFDVRSFYNETEICQKLLPPVFDGRAIFKTVTSDLDTIRCYDSVFENGKTDSLDITSKIYRLINLFYQNNLIEIRAQPKNASVKKIVDYIEENASNELTVDMLCKKFNYSKTYLCRKFRQATGLPPMAYLKIYRLELARKKIINSDSRINDIAAECGFFDANYFTRCFMRHFSKSPSQYKKECRQS